MNFIFISPNFPKSYYNFCKGLKQNGVTTLGIGDEPYVNLSKDVKDSLDEYYFIANLNDYDDIYRACAFFAFKYGKIDWLESNNEFWLERDASLRSDFNITSGIQSNRIETIKLKSKMKGFYEKANVPVARYHLVEDYAAGKTFVDEVAFPIVVKPDNGVGSFATYRLNNLKELKTFYKKLPDIPYIMEEYVDGYIISYDGIAGKNKEIIFETCHVFPNPIMDVVNKQEDVWYYSLKDIPNDLKEMGHRVVETFDTNSRFFHLEFFCLNNDRKGLGKKGDLIALEVNMRPPGGYTPDMMNYAFDIDVYQIWSNMITYNKGNFDKSHRPYSCVYASRRDQFSYVYSVEEILEKYKKNIVMEERMPDVFSNAMGNFSLTARFKSEKESISFAHIVTKRKQ